MTGVENIITEAMRLEALEQEGALYTPYMDVRCENMPFPSEEY